MIYVDIYKWYFECRILFDSGKRGCLHELSTANCG